MSTTTSQIVKIKKKIHIYMNEKANVVTCQHLGNLRGQVVMNSLLFLQLFYKTDIFSEYNYILPTPPPKKRHVVEQLQVVSTVMGCGS